MTQSETQYVICRHNDGYEAALQRGKRYATKRDEQARAFGLLRVVDESGSDYLYPAEAFLAVTPPS